MIFTLILGKTSLMIKASANLSLVLPGKVLTTNEYGKFQTTTYIKPTNKGLYTNFNSHSHMSYITQWYRVGLL